VARIRSLLVAQPLHLSDSMKKRLVRSWDVFDTLIARKCGHPNGIFRAMAAEFGDGFSASRVHAEIVARATKQEISLCDIYDSLQIATGWNAEVRQRALDLEIRIEFENVIPITENLSRVRNGDIVVSDMYLPREIIMRLLRAAGLDKDVNLFVSNNGKGDGSMWKRLNKQYYILKHTGDNPRSDFLRPLLYGIPSGITEASDETSWERMLRCNGAPALSAYVREMRLRTFHKNKASRTVQNAQIEANFPLLLLASASLVHWCREHGISRALMSSRDCVLWASLAEQVARHADSDLAIEYFLISRVAALRSSEQYLEYASKRIKPDSVVVDLSMTGVSLAGLADRLGIKDVRAFVIAWQNSSAKSLYGENFHPKAKVNIEFLTAGLIDDDLEAVNQAPTPSIHDVHETSNGLSVTYASENRARPVLEAISVQDATFTELLERIPEAVLTESLELAKSTRLVFLVRECARHAGSFKTVISRARPGAALWNDPNGIKLNLQYATQHPVLGWFAQRLKRLLKPLILPGSFLHRYGKILILIFQLLKKKLKKLKLSNDDTSNY
jgi:hypothetical protein